MHYYFSITTSSSFFKKLFIVFISFVLAAMCIWSCSKKNDKMNFSKKSHFMKSVSRFKARYKKIIRFTQCIVQYVWCSVRNFFWKMCNIEAKIEYFAFLNCCNLTFLQAENIIKFLKNFVKEGRNFSQKALCEGFSYRKCEILWLLSCIA